MDNNKLINTQIAIKYIKDNFEKEFSKKLSLVRVSAPLFVKKNSGLNDDLSGLEESVSFKVKEEEISIVHSLAKWKRVALKNYDFDYYSGLYTDMNAIRKDENLDRLHSIYVDQWDWERIIKKEDRNLSYLFDVVNDIYSVIYHINKLIYRKYKIKHELPKHITFISTNELVDKYPGLTNKEREKAITKLHKAVFIYRIGWPLSDGYPFDSRASDYDDWTLNGDILVYSEAIDDAIELSSMGIRVDSVSLKQQIEYKKEEYKLDNPYCKKVLNNELPFTIGGGIGQSRLCMFYLNKKHIGEVQASYWPDDIKTKLKEEGIEIL